jgi:succinoglycan biosynthesis transport protein ExoP
VDEHPESDVRHYLGVLRRRAAIVVLVTGFAVAAAVAFSFTSTRVYAASSQVVLADPGQGSVFSAGPTFDLSTNIATQIEIVRSRPVVSAVNKQLGADVSKIGDVSAAQLGTTQIIVITVESPEPRVAKRTADLYAQLYVTTRQTQQVDSLLAASTVIQQKLTEVQTRLETLDAQIAALDPTVTPPPDLQNERDAVTAQAELYREKLDQLQVDASLRTGGAQVAQLAELPGSPVRPKPLRDGALAAALGLVLGVALVFVAEFLDDKLNTAEAVTRYGDGLTVLAEIPSVPGWRNRRATRVVALDEPDSVTAEAYRSLRTSLQIIALRQPIQSVLVTSPIAAEGKTTTAVNLGVTIARGGRTVVVVDLDFRRPRLADFFNIDRDVGLSSVFVGDVPLSAALHDVPVAEGAAPLRILPSGPVPSNPSELLGTSRMAEMLASLQSYADLVIIDSPPLLPVTDALVLSNRVDGVLLVVSAGQTRRRHLGRAVELLRHAEAPVLGAVLNATSAQQRRRYGYGYAYRASDAARNGDRARSRSADRS